MTEIAIRKDSEPEIDEELLAEAQRQLGASSRNEALNAGLQLLVEQARNRRREALAELRRMSDEGLFDYTALDVTDQ